MSLRYDPALLASILLHVSVAGAFAYWKYPVAERRGGADLSPGAEATTVSIRMMAPKAKPKPVPPTIQPTPTPGRTIIAAVAAPRIVLPTAPAPSLTPAVSAPEAKVAAPKSAPAKGAARAAPRSGTTGTGTGVRAAEYRKRAVLVYPAKSQRLHQRGVVKLKVLVNPQGTAEQVHVQQSSGHALLDAAACTCAQQSSYVPAQRQGTAISAWVEASFRFE